VFFSYMWFYLNFILRYFYTVSWKLLINNYVHTLLPNFSINSLIKYLIRRKLKCMLHELSPVIVFNYEYQIPTRNNSWCPHNIFNYRLIDWIINVIKTFWKTLFLKNVSIIVTYLGTAFVDSVLYCFNELVLNRIVWEFMSWCLL